MDGISIQGIRNQSASAKGMYEAIPNVYILQYDSADLNGNVFASLQISGAGLGKQLTGQSSLGWLALDIPLS